MADIVIRGMEEPPFCSACRMLDGDTDDGFCHATNKWLDDEWFCWYQYPDGDIATDKPLNCPLVPLPEGHGRLGDLDALEAKLQEEALQHTLIGDLNRMTLGVGEVIDRIRMAKTIVPAEGTESE